ncbi:DEAD/DEAH box helicase [Anaerosolibacter sp.]|uniref:DEAD/DEAH box helicase n=1 Tax=Anaerosolibacter sp. TaxID=1872527 RepID=UPI002ED5301D
MSMNFNLLGISKELCDVLHAQGISEATPIQEETIPALLQRKDVIAQAQTGTGKTLAFLLPAMEKIDVNKSSVQTLVITPTRELAIQITAEARKLAPVKDIKILAAYGGQDVEQQVRKLKGNIHMVIGTPGRLLDHLRRKTVDFSKLDILVLDEADQMLHMGFLKEVETIIRHTWKDRQTMCFSATMPKGVRELASRYMNEPIQIKTKSDRVTLDEIEQIVVDTTDRGKQDALCQMIDEYKPFMAIIFCRTKRRVTALNEALHERGYQSDELHGDLTQGKREKVMKSFRNMEIPLLVATDVAARGLDIEGITHIFNYDIPQDAESYVHRIGRTGRAGQTGVAITFVTPKDYEDLQIIEKTIQMTIKKRRLTKEKEFRVNPNRKSDGRDRSEERERKSRGNQKGDRFKHSDKSGSFKRSSDGKRKHEEKRNTFEKKTGSRNQNARTKSNQRGKAY